MSPTSDIEIARAATKLPIQQIGDKLGIPAQDLLPFGHDKANCRPSSSPPSKAVPTAS